MIFDFSRDTVLASIRANRDAHAVQLEEVTVSWRAELADAVREEIARLQTILRAAENGTLLANDVPRGERGVATPISHLTDYEVAIRMLEMASTDAVSLPENDFARYVLDQWDWRGSFDDRLADLRWKDRMRQRRGGSTR